LHRETSFSKKYAANREEEDSGGKGLHSLRGKKIKAGPRNGRNENGKREPKGKTIEDLLASLLAKFSSQNRREDSLSGKRATTVCRVNVPKTSWEYEKLVRAKVSRTLYRAPKNLESGGYDKGDGGKIRVTAEA